MCRFVVYRGDPILMADLITRSRHSLIRQSYDSKERKEPLNGDGFGVGWYAPEVDVTPCVFTSVTPAWSNRNLHRLAAKIRSCCFFAHVRAATPGFVVSDVNCHPFQSGRFLWMHNGFIGGFRQLVRRLRAELSDELYHGVEGTSDTEHAFALFLHLLGSKRALDVGRYSTGDLAEAMRATIDQIVRWSRESGCSEPSLLNFALTDGSRVVATRYVNEDSAEPPTLYLTHGSRFECQGEVYHMAPSDNGPRAVIISSEPLTLMRDDWEPVPRNHRVTIDSSSTIELAPI